MDRGRDTTKSFQVRESAWLSSTHITGPEDSNSELPWCGPFSVVASMPSTVTLDLPSHWCLTSNTFHVEKVKKHVDRPAHLGTHSPPPVQFQQQGQDYWEIDSIVAHRRVGQAQLDGLRKLEYRVWWTGYGPAHDTWQ